MVAPRPWTPRWLCRRAVVILVAAAVVVWSVINLPEREKVAPSDDPEPGGDRITVRTPAGTQVIEAKVMSLRTLIESNLPKGTQRTKVTVAHRISEHWPDGHGKVVVEFTRESVLPEDQEVLKMYKGWAIPGSSVVEVTVDEETGEPDQGLFFRSGIEGEWSRHYRFDEWEGRFGLPPGSPSASDKIVIDSQVVWSCESKEEDGYYWEGTYILKPSSEALAMLATALCQHSAPTYDEAKNPAGEIVRYGFLEEEHCAPIRAKHGLSSTTQIECWWMGDVGWWIGIDHEKGLVYWRWMDDS